MLDVTPTCQRDSNFMHLKGSNVVTTLPPAGDKLYLLSSLTYSFVVFLHQKLEIMQYNSWRRNTHRSVYAKINKQTLTFVQKKYNKKNL